MINTVPGQMPSPVSNFWIYNTMLIENQWGGRGTGFLVFKPKVPGSNEGRVFLITNKHVINSEPRLRAESSHITLHLNFKGINNTISSKEAEFPTHIGNTKLYRYTMDFSVKHVSSETRS